MDGNMNHSYIYIIIIGFCKACLYMYLFIYLTIYPSPIYEPPFCSFIYPHFRFPFTSSHNCHIYIYSNISVYNHIQIYRYTYLFSKLLHKIVLMYHLIRIEYMYMHIYMHTHIFLIPLFPISSGKAALFSSGDAQCFIIQRYHLCPLPHFVLCFLILLLILCYYKQHCNVNLYRSTFTHLYVFIV